MSVFQLNGAGRGLKRLRLESEAAPLRKKNQSDLWAGDSASPWIRGVVKLLLTMGALTAREWRALLEKVILDKNFPHYSVWEPACGEGRIAKVLKEHFGRLDASDIFPFGYREVMDFLVPQAVRDTTWKKCSVADAEPVKGGGPVCAGIIEKQVVISAYLRESGYELAHASF